MGKLKPWQVLMLILGVGAVIFIAIQVNRSGNRLDLPHRGTLIDVVTGEVFEIDTSKKGGMLPAIHPESHTRTLLRIHKVENGKWYVVPRDLPLLPDIAGEKKAVNPSNGEVLVDVPEHPLEYVEPVL